MIKLGNTNYSLYKLYYLYNVSVSKWLFVGFCWRYGSHLILIGRRILKVSQCKPFGYTVTAEIQLCPPSIAMQISRSNYTC